MLDQGVPSGSSRVPKEYVTMLHTEEKIGKAIGESFFYVKSSICTAGGAFFQNICHSEKVGWMYLLRMCLIQRNMSAVLHMRAYEKVSFAHCLLLFSYDIANTSYSLSLSNKLSMQFNKSVFFII